MLTNWNLFQFLDKVQQLYSGRRVNTSWFHQHTTAMTLSNAAVLNERSGHVANPKQQTKFSAYPSVKCVCFPVRGLKVLGPKPPVGWPTCSKVKTNLCLASMNSQDRLTFSWQHRTVKDLEHNLMEIAPHLSFYMLGELLKQIREW